MNHRHVRYFVKALSFIGAISFPFSIHAAGFQLWEQDGASPGLFHAGYAASASDASTAFYNPAGMSRFKHQQLVVGGMFVWPRFKYRGSLDLYNDIPPDHDIINILSNPHVSAQGGKIAVVPNLNYVAPINDRMNFGFSIVVPFGLSTDYGRGTDLRYAATLSKIEVIDIAPSLSYQLSDAFSLGAGLDIERAAAEMNAIISVASLGGTDNQSTNKLTSTGIGYHLGGLYQFSPATRFGISYHSKVTQHFKGSSKFEGELADAINDGRSIRSRNAKTTIDLPAWTALSFYHQYTPQIAVLGSVIYTQWGVFDKILFKNMAGPDPNTLVDPSTTIEVTIPQHYRNTWNLSLGTEYALNECVLLRGGIGFDETPASNAYRNVQLPDNNRYVIAAGAHYQMSKAIGFDVGWTHFFIHKAKINPPNQVLGSQITRTKGKVNGSADLFSAQVVWDIV